MYGRVRDTKSQLEAISTIDDNVQLIQIEIILRSLLGNNSYRHIERSNYPDRSIHRKSLLLGYKLQY